MTRRLLLLTMAVAAAGAEAPRRIVSLSPNITEMLYGMGAFDRLVGVTDYCTYPPQASKLPSVGGWHTPSLEKLAGMRPDLVIVDDAEAAFLQDQLRDLNLRVLVVPNHSVADIFTAIATLGRAIGHEAEAAKLAAQTHEGLDRVRRRTTLLARPGVIVMVSRTPGTLQDLYTATEGSYLAELVEIAGGRIAAPANPRGYARLSMEDLLAINPDVVLDFIHGSESRLAGNPMEAWKEMPELKAVRARRIHGVGE